MFRSMKLLEIEVAAFTSLGRGKPFIFGESWRTTDVTAYLMLGYSTDNLNFLEKLNPAI